MKINVLVAGAGGASLGTEIVKCLKLRNDLYNIYTCDISFLAFGLYEEGIVDSFISDNSNYYSSIVEKCIVLNINVIIPGGEKPMELLLPHIKDLREKNIFLASNSADVVELCSDKLKLFHFLKEKNITIPKSVTGLNENSYKELTYPCIVKPSKGSGGSVSVFFVENEHDARLYAHQIKNSGNTPLFQEYLPLDEGEYTFSVLSTPDGNIFGGIGLKKNFDTKLLYIYKSDKGLISSGYSQGLIGEFPDIFNQVCIISNLVKSCGPLNIEGRVIGGVFVPFEINPRFSATTYLWAMAGFNDVDYFIQLLCNIPFEKKKKIIKGYSIRSFTEKFLPIEKKVALRKNDDKYNLYCLE